MLKGFVFLLLLLGLNRILTARDQTLDSLLSLAENMNDEEKAAFFIESSNQLVYSHTGDALLLSEKAFDLSTELQNDSLKFAALKAMGYANGYLGNLEKALQNMRDGLLYFEEINDSIRIAEALGDIAYLLQATSANENLVMEYNLKALVIREKINDLKGVAYSLNNIGALYWKWGKYDQSVNYFLRALPHFEQLNLKEEVATLRGNIGSYYIETDEYDQARDFLHQALNDYKALGHKYGEAKILATLGRMHYRMGETERAIEMNQQSKIIREKLGDREGLVGNNYNLGLYFLEKKQFTKADESLNESRILAEEIGLPNRLIQIYQSLSDLAFERKDYANAYSFLQKSKELNDSVFSVEKHRQLEEIRTRYDVEKKEAENEMLMLQNEDQRIILRKNRFIMFLSLSVAFLLVLFLLFYDQKKRSIAQLKTMQAEQRLLRSQMNPHFIFNAITAIQSYLFTHTPRETANYLSAFAALMRQILENSQKELIELSDELKWLNNYFTLQRLRYSNRFDFEIVVDEAFDQSKTMIPPMVVQPFIENAIEHGVKEKTEGGMICLRYLKTWKGLQIEIEDNGKGLDQSANMADQSHRSFAVEATKKRLEALHLREHSVFQFELIDLATIDQSNTGTLVRFNLPFIEKY
jgi:tetratricopeptide (TPR) repeat protein